MLFIRRSVDSPSGFISVTSKSQRSFTPHDSDNDKMTFELAGPQSKASATSEKLAVMGFDSLVGSGISLHEHNKVNNERERR
jgi:hypothetical protein